MKLVRKLKQLFSTPAEPVHSSVTAAIPPKDWGRSQDYELVHSIAFMDTPDFRSLANMYHSGGAAMSRGYVNDLMLREFFGGERDEWTRFVAHITGKNCLEIGPAVISPLAGWDIAAERHVVEPLLTPVELWQHANLGYSVFDGLEKHSHGAEQLIPNAVGRIDGAIYCRNCLDHTPHWPFILGNISQYAAPGCRLLLWLDLDHRGIADEGHYDITTDPEAFKRLIEAFGFDIVREYVDSDRHELNWGCYAVKR